MARFGSLIRGVAVAAAIVGVGALPSTVGAQGGPAPGTVTVAVVVTGDAGGDPSAVSLLIERNTGTGNNETVVTAPGAGSQSFELDPGSYVLTASTSDAAYVITSTTCDSQPGNGPNTADFIIDGDGPGGGGDAACVVSVTYTAPPPTEPPTDTTMPPTDTTMPPTETTDPPADTTMPPTESTVPDSSEPATTTIDQAASPPSDGATPTEMIPVTGSSDQTPAIVLAALGALVLGGGALAAARRR